jgi:hypothetical protein
MGGLDEATRHLAEAHDGWEPRDTFEHAGADLSTAGIQVDLGQLDAAERSAASAVRTYGQSHRRGRTLARLPLVEPNKLTMPRSLPRNVSLSSVSSAVSRRGIRR